MCKLWLLLGSLSLVLLINATSGNMPDCFKLDDDYCPNANMTYQLHTKSAPWGSPFEPFDLWTELDLTTPLKVILHGFGGSVATTPNLELIPALMRVPGVSVLAVDYKNLVPEPCYTEAVHNVPYIGRCVAQLLGDLLNTHQMVPQNLHLIGYGIGAHVAGYVANFLQEAGFRIGHITGLDPAKALYLTPDPYDRLDRTDADFVDIIHTDVFLHGLMQPVGHADFYPNKGVMQPNCGPITEFDTHACYHRRAVEYYAESVTSKDNFWAFRCADLHAFIVGECVPTENNNDYELMGYHASPFARGNFFLQTNENEPYAEGKSFENLDRSLYGKTYLGDALVDKLQEMGDEFKVLTQRLSQK